MENEREGIEETLFRLLDYQAERGVDNDSLLIMLSLLNLMGLVNALNRSEAGTSPAGGINLQSLLPLLAVAAAGMGGGPGGQFNPAALLGLLGGMPGGGQKDLAGMLSLLGPLMGMGAQGQAAAHGGQSGKKVDSAPQPVQREINLDWKNKPDLKNAKVNKDGEQVTVETGLLEWKFGRGAR